MKIFPYPFKELSAICDVALGLHLKSFPHTWQCPSLLQCRETPHPCGLQSCGGHTTGSLALCSQTCQWDVPEKWHHRSRSPEDKHQNYDGFWRDERFLKQKLFYRSFMGSALICSKAKTFFILCE